MLKKETLLTIKGIIIHSYLFVITAATYICTCLPIFRYCLTLEQLSLAWDLGDNESSNDEEENYPEGHNSRLSEADITKLESTEQQLMSAFQGIFFIKCSIMFKNVYNYTAATKCFNRNV